MKKVLLLILVFLIEVGYAQFIPHKATITTSKDSVSSKEEFIVTYSLSEVEGYVYIGVQDGYFDIIGKDRWEGYIKYGETAVVSFAIKFKEKIKPYLYGEKVSLSIGFSYYPFGEAVIGGAFETILIKLSDFDDFNKKESDLKDSSIQGDGSSIRLDLHQIPYNTEMPILRDEVTPDTGNIRLYYPGSSGIDILKFKKNNFTAGIKENVKNYIRKNSGKNDLELPLEIIVRFDAASMSFRNLSNQQYPWQYYTVWILGLQYPSDPYPVVIEEQIIQSSYTGEFSIETSENYPYYQCVMLLKGDVYIALRPPDSWNGSDPVDMYYYGLSTDPIQRPT